MKIESCSPSRIKTADECDFKYYMSYELGIGDQLTSSPFASRYGSIIHNVLEKYALAKGKFDYKAELLRQTLHVADPDVDHDQTLRPYDEMEQASKRVKAMFFDQAKDCHSCPYFDGGCSIMAKQPDEFEGCPRALYDDALRMIEAAIKRYDKYFKTGIKSADNPDGKVLGVELEFTIELGKDNWGDPIIMHGFIDLVIEEDEDTAVVIDYKSGFKTFSAEELMNDMQARMYSVAAKRVLSDYKFVLLTFDYFRGIPVDVVFTEEQDNITVETVKRRWNEIKAKRKIKRRPYDWYCQYLCNRAVCNREWEKIKVAAKKKPEGMI